MIDYAVSEPMKYWTMNTKMSREERRNMLQMLAASGNYIWSRKYDGNYSRAILGVENPILQTRGISKKTGTYGEIQDKVLFWDSVKEKFHDYTVILGEVYLEGGVDKDVGSILRCLTPKALARQKEQKLQWRIFDVICYEGQDLSNTPISERCKYIEKVVKTIDCPLVTGIEYHEMGKDFFKELEDIFDDGGEGVVCYKKSAKYEPGKRGPSAWDSIKVKKELVDDKDVFIIGTKPSSMYYDGDHPENWEYWMNSRTFEKIHENLYARFSRGEPYVPISKGYYYEWPSAIQCGVYDENGNVFHLCDVSGITEEMKCDLRDNWERYNLMPLRINGMAVSEARGYSIRHPKLVCLRENDIDPKDCTLAKIKE